MEEVSKELGLQISAAAMELKKSTFLLDKAQASFENFATLGSADLDALTDLQNLDYASQIVRCVSNFLETISAENEHVIFDLNPRDVALKILSGDTSG